MDRKTVLVTGGAAGIGAGIARRFAEAGYAVAIFDIDGPSARTMAAELEQSGTAMSIAGDVSNEAQVGQAVERTVAEFGCLDVLVNNAGKEINGSVCDLSAAAWEDQMAVNLRGVFLMSKYAIGKMTRRGGAIINISSVHALVSWPGCAAYDTTKA